MAESFRAIRVDTGIRAKQNKLSFRVNFPMHIVSRDIGVIPSTQKGGAAHLDILGAMNISPARPTLWSWWSKTGVMFYRPKIELLLSP